MRITTRIANKNVDLQYYILYAELKVYSQIFARKKFFWSREDFIDYRNEEVISKVKSCLNELN